MSGTSHDIVFFGTEDFSLVALQSLVKAGFPVKLVVTKPDSRRGRKKILTEPRVKTYARAHAIPVRQPHKLREIINDITALQAPAGVLVSYGKIIPQAIIDLFAPGITNVHPSLLPRYRGPSPIESALINGDRETGVSLMQLAAAMDAGPIYTQETVPLDGTETQSSLYESLGARGGALLIQHLPAILSGTLCPTPQNDAEASYCQLLGAGDALVDPRAITAAQFERHIRAYQTFPRSKLNWHDRRLIITRGHITDIQKTPLDILCRDGKFFAIDELVAPSGKCMSSADFLRGYAAD